MESISLGPNPSQTSEKLDSANPSSVKGVEAPVNLTPEKTPEVALAPAASPGHFMPGPTLPSPVTPQPPQLTPTSLSVSDTPLAANDDDVIEKEWVNKAKKIVAETRHDPYAQEKQVSRLQADYVKKRYGKEIKISGD